MGIINYLKEELNSAKIMMGKTNSWFDPAKGSYEVFFKVNGITYSFLAESEGTEYEDGCWKIQMRKKWEGNTEAIEDNEDIINAFVEAIIAWVNLKNPTSFYWIKSEKYPAYNNIAEALAKKIKQYTFIDESKTEHLEFDVQERSPEELVKRYIFTLTHPKETFKDPEEWYEKKTMKNDKVFGIYEPIKDIKPNPEHTSTFTKSSKLDKNFNYNNKKIS